MSISGADFAAWFAARGWPVHPCSAGGGRSTPKLPLLAADKGPDGKAVRGTGGVSKATTDSGVIAGWWQKWPGAMIGLATGHERLFVLDFDPRVDEDTGEVWTLDRLRADLLSQMAAAAGHPVALPESVTAMTPSGGVHVYYQWPDDGGAPIRNRGALPDHVDVRGLGGYVIAPPSQIVDGGGYRWLRPPVDWPVADAGKYPPVAVAEAPAVLIEILRGPAPGRERPAPRPAVQSVAGGDAMARQEAAVARYADRAMEAELDRVRGAAAGTRNAALNQAAFAIASLVAAGALRAVSARAELEAAAAANPGRDSTAQIAATIDSGWAAGMERPRDLSDIGQRSGGWRRDDARGPRGDGYGTRAQDPAPRPASAASNGGVGRNGDMPALTPEGVEGARLAMIAADWWMRRVEALRTMRGRDGFADALTRAAFMAGARMTAGMLPEQDVLPVLDEIGWDEAAAVARSVAAGRAAGYDPSADLLALRGAVFPKTDLGNAERFHLRHGHRYRYTTAAGWLAWSGRHWQVIDQEADKTPPAVLAAVFDTVRAIQREAAAVRATGFKSDENPHGMDVLIPLGKNRETTEAAELIKHGRSSEGNSRLGCIAALAKRWVTVPFEDFDTDDLAINCENGTLRIRRDQAADGRTRAVVSLDPHNPADLISKIVPVAYDPAATAPTYDAVFAWAQPDAARRRYLHQWGGYGLSGHTGAQILHFWYGLGSNGKSTIIDAWAGAAGDYAGTIGIETFLDQGIKRRGDAATPDLARLGGVRLLRASEPERGASLNEALIKAATGGEPMAVRMLNKGFFDLRPKFKLTIGGNHKPKIHGTDDGIWRRMKLIPWEQSLRPEERDADMPAKLRAEYPGIFAQLVRGLVDWVENGFVEPESVTAATAAYRDDSDPLGRFIGECVESAPGERVQSSALYALFCAWAKAAGESEWKNKGFTQAMRDKGWHTITSNGTKWLDMRLTRRPGDFVDADGRVIERADDAPPVDPDPSRWEGDDYGAVLDDD